MSIVSSQQNIDQVFSVTQYYIDFYQREYKWKRPQVQSLLDDIFHRFGMEYSEHKDPTHRLNHQLKLSPSSISQLLFIMKGTFIICRIM